MVFIGNFVNDLIAGGMTHAKVAELCSVGMSQISAYKKGTSNPSLATAIKVYKVEGIILHPFSKESLKYELEKNNE